MGELCDKLTEYSKSDVYPFHMPGHKRNMEWLVNPYDLDITEITGFDDLHNPSGILARINESFESLFLAETIYGKTDITGLINIQHSDLMLLIHCSQITVIIIIETKQNREFIIGYVIAE